MSIDETWKPDWVHEIEGHSNLDITSIDRGDSKKKMIEKANRHIETLRFIADECGYIMNRVENGKYEA